MIRGTTRKALVAALLAVAGAAFAQTTPPTESGTTPSPAGQRPGRGMQGPGLLLRPEVQQDLKLTSDQVSKIQALLPAPGSAPQRMTREERQEQVKQIQGILTPEQYTRYQQILLQVAGPSALVRRQVAKEVGLSDDQVSQIRTIISSYQPGASTTTPAAGTAGPAGGAPRGAARLTRAQREERDAKILAVLTADQKTKWTSMLGDPIKLEMGRGRRR